MSILAKVLGGIAIGITIGLIYPTVCKINDSIYEINTEKRNGLIWSLWNCLKEVCGLNEWIFICGMGHGLD